MLLIESLDTIARAYLSILKELQHKKDAERELEALSYKIRQMTVIDTVVATGVDEQLIRLNICNMQISNLKKQIADTIPTMKNTLRYFKEKKAIIYSEVSESKWAVWLDGDTVILKPDNNVDIGEFIAQIEV